MREYLQVISVDEFSNHGVGNNNNHFIVNDKPGYNRFIDNKSVISNLEVQQQGYRSHLENQNDAYQQIDGNEANYHYLEGIYFNDHQNSHNEQHQVQDTSTSSEEYSKTIVDLSKLQ